jgi:hypothetical protein
VVEWKRGNLIRARAGVPPHATTSTPPYLFLLLLTIGVCAQAPVFTEE